MTTPIRTLRESKRLSLRELARISGIDATRISRIERCVQRPTVDQLHRLAVVLGMDALATDLEPYIGIRWRGEG